MSTTKVCSKCGVEKELDFFHKNATGKNGKSAFCKSCAISRAAIWYKANRERVKVVAREWRTANPEKVRARGLKRNFGFTLEKFDTLSGEQNGACAICKVPFSKTPHVDHNHTTGKVRGLLCGNHNKGLGLFQDNPAYLRAAADYLEENA